MKPGKIAALGKHEGELCVWIEGEQRPMPANKWAALTVLPIFDWMAAWGIGVLHVHASALPLLGLPDALDVPRPGESRPTHPFVANVRVDGKLVSSRSLAPSIVAGDREILIGAYQDGAGDPFEDAADAHELLSAHLHLTAALDGWQWRNSAAVTGWKLMHAPWMHGPRKARLAKVDDWPNNERPQPGDDVRQVELPYGSWAVSPMVRSFKHDQLPYVSAWDVNGQRLAACARLSLGLGGLEHRDYGSFEKALPGYHRVTAIERAPEFEGMIPPIFELGWHTTPRVAMAGFLGMKMMIAESWVWTEHTPYLNPWYERLRDARARLHELAEQPGDALAVELAGDALKQLYLQPLGRLRSRRARERGDLYYRPDWYDAVIGQELAREYLRLHKLAEAGVPIIAVYYDTILIETAEPLQAPEGLPVSDQLGKYKPLGAIPTDQARSILYADERPNVAALIRAIKGAASPAGSPFAFGHERATVWQRPMHGGYPDAAS